MVCSFPSCCSAWPLGLGVLAASAQSVQRPGYLRMGSEAPPGAACTALESRGDVRTPFSVCALGQLSDAPHYHVAGRASRGAFLQEA